MKLLKLLLISCLFVTHPNISYAWWGSNSYSSQDTNYDGRSYGLDEFKAMQGYETPKTAVRDVKPSFWHNVGSWLSNAFSGIKDFAVKSYNFVKDISVNIVDSIKNIFVKEPDSLNIDMKQAATVDIERSKTDVSTDQRIENIPVEKTETANVVENTDPKIADFKDIENDNQKADLQVADKVDVDVVEPQLISASDKPQNVDAISSVGLHTKQDREDFIPYQMAVKDVSDAELVRELKVHDFFTKDFEQFKTREKGQVSDVSVQFNERKIIKFNIVMSEIKQRQENGTFDQNNIKQLNKPDSLLPDMQTKANENWQSQFFSENMDQESYYPVLQPKNVTITNSSDVSSKTVLSKVEEHFAGVDLYDKTGSRYIQALNDLSKRAVVNMAVNAAGNALGGELAKKAASETTKTIIKTSTATAVSEVIPTKVYLLENDKKEFNDALEYINQKISNNNVDVQSFNQNIITSREALKANLNQKFKSYGAAAVAGAVKYGIGGSNLITAIGTAATTKDLVSIPRTQPYEAGQVNYSLKMSFIEYDPLYSTKYDTIKHVDMSYRTGKYLDKSSNKVKNGVIDVLLLMRSCNIFNSNCTSREVAHAPK